MDQTEQIMQAARGLRAHWLTSITPHGRQAIHGISPRLVALLDELERRLDPARQRAASVTGRANPPVGDWTGEQYEEAQRRFGLPAAAPTAD